MRVIGLECMADVNNQPILVGSKVISNGKVTNVLSVWEELSPT